jgi:hypothetical protein
MASRMITRSVSKKARIEAYNTSTQREALEPYPETLTDDTKETGLDNDFAQSVGNFCYLDHLPNEILDKIGSFMPYSDLFTFSHLNKRLLSFFGPENEKYKKMLLDNNITRSSVIEETVPCK